MNPRLRNRGRKPNANRNVRWKPPRPHKSFKKKVENNFQLSNEIVSALKGPLKPEQPSKVAKSPTPSPVGWMTVDTFKIGPPPPTTTTSSQGFTTKSSDLLSTTPFPSVTMGVYEGTPSPPFADSKFDSKGADRLWKLSGVPLKSKASISLNIRPWMEWTRERFDLGIPIVNPFTSVRNIAAKAVDGIRSAVLQFRHKVWMSFLITTHFSS